MRWTVSEPIATANPHRITNVSSADTPARRVRMGSPSKLADRRAPTPPAAGGSPGLVLGAKDVPRSSDRVQQARLALGLELAAQVRHEHLDGVGGGERVIAPHVVEQALAGDHDPLVAHQVLEQLELALRQ